jgi:CHAT domain-containing protein/tetratricopeptide (TPR) repeat protein
MNFRLFALAAAIAIYAGAPLHAQSDISTADSFRIGNAGVLCSAQNLSADSALTGMFDRAHAIVCRDAASEVGKLFQFRSSTIPDANKWGNEELTCAAPQLVDVAGLSSVRRSTCMSASGLRHYRYQLASGTVQYVAQGLAGYDSALRLGLLSIVKNRPVAGAVDVAVTEAGDPAAFARVQASKLDSAQVRVEGYNRNNAGNFAEAATFFDVLSQSNKSGPANKNAEGLANQALQQSNLGDFAEAGNLFERAKNIADASDPLLTRIMRNYEAMHALNMGDSALAIAALNRPVAIGIGNALEADRLVGGYIDRPIAQKLNNSSREMVALGGTGSTLTLSEKIEILDLQSAHLRGVILRREGDRRGAVKSITESEAGLAAMRGGRVASVAWLRATNLSELSQIAETEGQLDSARRYLESASLLLEQNYPLSAAALAARARHAGFLARHGDPQTARSMFRKIVADSANTPGAGNMLSTSIAPYLKLLADTGSGDANAADDFFMASQTLARPGVAQTQAVLSRELSAGDDAAASLFRQSLNLSRDIVRLESELALIRAATEMSAAEALRLPAALRELDIAKGEQTKLLAQLAEYPRYRALGGDSITLADLRKKLRSGEGYYKMVVNAGSVYGLFLTQQSSHIVNTGISEDELSDDVATIRDSIVISDGSSVEIFPFDIAMAHALYKALFGPIDAEIKQISHLVFEPDGAMLQLPVNLLVTAPESVAAYETRIAKPDADEFDFTDTAWLARGRIVSTSVSPKAFVDVRDLKAARGTRAYLGLGENAPVAAAVYANMQQQGGLSCNWPASFWAKPISSAELKLGANQLGASASELLTGSAFTDTALRARSDLSDFRVIHFATHGLVTAPNPECPAQPSLLTSVGEPGVGAAGSDGLLTFTEIFDMKLDADTIILSACDTAGMATTKATRAAGISTGGNYALDGLVRAFIGAGARTVVASHWPVPDDYGATATLISSLFDRAGSVSVGQALAAGQQKMMDIAATSHPYYWSGFAIIGDASRPIMGAAKSPEQPIALR